MGSISFSKLFYEELGKGLKIFSGGREQVEVSSLTTAEENAIQECMKESARLIERISPKLARDWMNHLTIALKFGQIAKAKFPVEKPISFPAEPGHLGVSPLIPQAIKYVSSPSSTNPAYSDYTINTWNISLTAGSAAYLLGSASAYYKANPTTDQHTLLVIFKDGLIEIGSSPKIQQIHFITEIQTRYGPWAVHPLIEIPIEPEKTIYQYNTLGVIPVYHDLGVKLSVLPEATGTSHLPLLGVFFYEYNFWSSLKNIT